MASCHHHKSAAAATQTRERSRTTSRRLLSVATAFIAAAACACNLAAAAPAPAAANVRYITLGVLRTNFGGLDSPQLLAGMMATVAELNAAAHKDAIVFTEDDGTGTGTTVPVAGTVEYRLAVTTIPCDTYMGCAVLTPAQEAQYVEPFLQSISSFAAVIQPNLLLAPRVIDAARDAGGVPVISPDASRAEDYSDAAQHVVNFQQRSFGQYEHLFTAMMHTDSCAHSGILNRGTAIPGPTGDGVRAATEHVQQVFADGQKVIPPWLDIDLATDADLENFVILDDPDRRCFVILTDYNGLTSVIERLAAMPSYNPELYSFYAGTIALGDDMTIAGGSTAAFGSRARFVHWVPPSITAAFAPYFTQWRAALNVPADTAGFFAPNEPIPTVMTTNIAAGHILTVYAAKAARNALLYAGGTYAWPAATAGAFPAPHSAVVDFFYKEAVLIDGTPFERLVRECPPLPQPQVCFCNTASRVSYLYRLNTSASAHGATFVEFDEEANGQRDATSLAFPNTCAYSSSSWSYPITYLFLLPKLAVPIPILQASIDIVTAALRVTALDHNFAASRPPRPLRSEFLTLTPGTNTQTGLDQNLHQIEPFVVFGSLEGLIYKTDKILTIFPNLLTAEEEDPPLVPHAQWSWTNLRLQPSQADYIHSLASYYKDNCALFTALRVIASTPSEAALIQKSFATVGLLVRVGVEIVVSADPQEWLDLVAAWAGPSTIPIAESNEGHVSQLLGGTSAATTGGLYRPYSGSGAATVANWPYILASSRLDAGQILSKASAHFVQFERGTFAIATNILSSVATPRFPNRTASTPSAPPITSDGGAGREADIIFCAFRREWWTPEAAALANPRLRQYASDARYHIAMLGLQLVDALTSAVAYDYGSTAAQVLYRLSVVTAAETVFGPFYNTTCSAKQIEENDRDRICQCVKGVRTVFVLSSRDMHAKVPSDRTKRYAFTMTTCGLVYKAYVAPPDYTLRLGSDSSLSAGAIAGIVIAVVGVTAMLVAALLFFACCAGRRNNRFAPKDPSLPFAIVFTDIQSSTALWARAPQAMSEAVERHHSIIRKAISNSKGYEVKTVGDSFMVAFTTADRAAAFAMDAQWLLFSAGAGWSEEIDAIYYELLLEGGMNGDDDDFAVVEEFSNHNNNNTNTYQQQQGVHAPSNNYYYAKTHQQQQHYTPSGSSAAINTANQSRTHLDNSQYGAAGAFNGSLVGAAGGGTHNLNTFNAAAMSISARLPLSPFVGASNYPHQHQSHHPNTIGTSLKEADGDINQQLPHVQSPVNTYQQQQQQQQQQMLLLTPSAHSLAVSHNIAGGAPIAATAEGGAFAADKRSGVAMATVHTPTAGTADVSSGVVTLRKGPQQTYENGATSTTTETTNGPSAHHTKTVNGINTFNNITKNNNNFSNGVNGGGGGFTDKKVWRGLRVRIGISYGLGEPRRDPVSQGYDYYGTVVNTAARVEGVGHGGQTLITEEAFNALSDEFIASRTASRGGSNGISAANNNNNNNNDDASSVASSSASVIAIIALGPQPLRGLDEPIKLFQMVPMPLAARLFPPLRLHVEKQSEDEDELTTIETATGTASNTKGTATATYQPSQSHRTSATATPRGGGIADPMKNSMASKPSRAPAGDRPADTPKNASASAATPPPTAGLYGRAAGNNNNNGNAASASVEEMIYRLCEHKKYSGRVAPEFVRIAFAVVQSLFAPTPDAFSRPTMRRLGDAWGLQAAAKALASGGGDGGKGKANTASDKLLVLLSAKICRTVLSTRRLRGVAVAIRTDSAVAVHAQPHPQQQHLPPPQALQKAGSMADSGIVI